MKLYTIGYTKSTADDFFGRLKKSGAKKLVDVRLNNTSQLAGFAKKDDLRYFAKAICGIDYEHRLEFAPTQDMLNKYRKQKGSWEDYERRFRNLIARRHIEKLDRKALDNACLVCAEDTPDRCHRRVVAEYLQDKWGNVEIIHL